MDGVFGVAGRSRLYIFRVHSEQLTLVQAGEKGYGVQYRCLLRKSVAHLW